MGRPGLRNCGDFYEARRGNRKRAEYSGAVKISDNLVQKISRSEDADEDYVEFLKLLYNYDKNSQSYTNEHGNDGNYDEVEVEDEDEIDPQYKIFLANAKPDGRSYILNVNTKDELPVSIKYEKESDCNYGCKCLCCKKLKDIETQKDGVDEEILLNICSKDELKNQRFPRTDLGYDSNRSMGGVDVIFEPSDPTSLRNNGVMSQKLRSAKCGASKRQGKRDSNRSMGGDLIFEPSNPTSLTNNGIMSRKLRSAKCGASKRQGKRASNRSMGGDVIFEPSNPTSLTNNGIMSRKLRSVKCGASKRQGKRDSNRSMGGDVINEPSNPTSLTNNGIMGRKLRSGKCGASKRQGKRETKIKSREEKMMEKGSKPVHVIGKEKASDVGEDYALLLENLQCENWGMKASLRSGCNIDYEASEDDLEILYDSNDMLKKISEPSEFRKKVMDLLKKPYNPKEYKELWTYVNDQKPVERNMESRRGGVKSYKTMKMGKSYLEYYTDLKERLKEVANDERKKLKIMRGFSFWLQNLTNAGAFKPWNDTEFLARVAESR